MEVNMIFLLFPAVAAAVGSFCAQAREAQEFETRALAIAKARAIAKIAPERVRALGPQPEELVEFCGLQVTFQEMKILLESDPASTKFRTTAAYAALRDQQ
jgi:hypothetical protein